MKPIRTGKIPKGELVVLPRLRRSGGYRRSEGWWDVLLSLGRLGARLDGFRDWHTTTHTVLRLEV